MKTKSNMHAFEKRLHYDALMTTMLGRLIAGLEFAIVGFITSFIVEFFFHRSIEATLPVNIILKLSFSVSLLAALLGIVTRTSIIVWRVVPFSKHRVYKYIENRINHIEETIHWKEERVQNLKKEIEQLREYKLDHIEDLKLP